MSGKSSWDPRNWKNPISWASNKLDNKDPAYKNEKEEIKKIAQLGQLISAVGGAVSAMGLFTGGIFRLVSVPLAYFSYNGFRVSQNLETISQNPNHYSAFFGWGSVVGKNDVDPDRVREALVKNTFYFDYFIERIMQSFAKKK